MFLKALSSVPVEPAIGAIERSDRKGRQNLDVAGDEGEADDYFILLPPPRTLL